MFIYQCLDYSSMNKKISSNVLPLDHFLQPLMEHIGDISMTHVNFSTLLVQLKTRDHFLQPLMEHIGDVLMTHVPIENKNGLPCRSKTMQNSV